MVVCLKDNRLTLTLIGALGVLSGLIIKNSSEQLVKSGNSVEPFWGKIIAPALFVVGWAIIAYSIVLPRSVKGFVGNPVINQKTLIVLVSIVGIVVSVYMMKKAMKENVEVQMIYPAMYVVGWLLLGRSVGSIYGYIAGGLALLSTMLTLPLQRSVCVVDGPGMPMLTTAFGLLAYANAL